MKRLIPGVVCVFLTVVARAGEDWRFFTVDGKPAKVRAMLMGLTGEDEETTVALRRESDGAVIRLRLSRLSEEDRVYIAASPAKVGAAGWFQCRKNAETRLAALKDAGMDESCETAVARSLEWIRARQNADGSWGTRFKCAITGLCLQALSGHGVTGADAESGVAMERGVAFLLASAKQKNRQFEGVFAEHAELIASPYEHAIATQALAEILAMEPGQPLVRSAVDRAVEVILKAQNGAGMWSYKAGLGYSVDARNDLSLSHWQVGALAMASRCLPEKRGLDQALTNAAAGIGKLRVSRQGYGGTNAAREYSQHSLTGCALWALCLAGKGEALEPGGAVPWLLAQEQEAKLNWNYGCELYAWYFNGCAFRQAGGAAWTWWRDEGVRLVQAAQRPDGSFPPEGSSPNAAGTSAAAGTDAEIYRQCLATLILEAPWRYRIP